MMNKALLGVILSLVVVVTLTATTARTGPKTSGKTAQSSNLQPDQGNGEKLFEIHCGRCHTPPDALSPRVVTAVLQHMRVRAMLSKQDEQAILNYIAPE